jgi:DNA-binding LytR/AlgR family response regulator
MVLSVLAVDDEVPSLDELSYLLRTSELVGSVSVTQSATDALRQLRDDHFDVVLLDIRMPGLDGLDLARVLARFSEPPVVVFVTAHEEHALEAFDVGAAGYLLKPLNRERLERVLRRATGGHQATEELDAVPVESGGRTILVDRQDISWVESAGDYVRLHLRDGPSYLLRAAISVLEEQWAGFVRIHRSYLVAVHDIRELRTDGSRTTVKVGETELPVSRRHLRELRDRLVRHARPGTR